MNPRALRLSFLWSIKQIRYLKNICLLHHGIYGFLAADVKRWHDQSFILTVERGHVWTCLDLLRGIVSREASLRRQLERSALNYLHYSRRLFILFIILEKNFILSQSNATSELTIPVKYLDSSISVLNYKITLMGEILAYSFYDEVHTYKS